ncbi:MAG: hypothetical protein IKT96_06115, partial [Paludibacteraceae bacterium]|nr:hypothetical protein [Paludibacteraceae bacterium]
MAHCFNISQMRLWLWICNAIISITKQFCTLLEWRKGLILLTISISMLRPVWENALIPKSVASPSLLSELIVDW